jgi:hypothetical protein
MGKFVYEGGVKTEIEDRALTHLQLVITAKLRRGEPFPFSWREDASVGGGRVTVWVQPGSSLVFKYFGSRQPAINRAWIEALAFTANAPSGLYLVPGARRGRRLSVGVGRDHRSPLSRSDPSCHRADPRRTRLPPVGLAASVRAVQRPPSRRRTPCGSAASSSLSRRRRRGEPV